MRKPAKGATLDEIECVYRQRVPEFRRVAAAILGDRELALDAVQEGFAIAVRQRATSRGDGSIEAARRSPESSARGVGLAGERRGHACARGGCVVAVDTGDGEIRPGARERGDVTPRAGL